MNDNIFEYEVDQNVETEPIDEETFASREVLVYEKTPITEWHLFRVWHIFSGFGILGQAHARTKAAALEVSRERFPNQKDLDVDLERDPVKTYPPIHWC